MRCERCGEQASLSFVPDGLAIAPFMVCEGHAGELIAYAQAQRIEYNVAAIKELTA